MKFFIILALLTIFHQTLGEESSERDVTLSNGTRNDDSNKAESPKVYNVPPWKYGWPKMWGILFNSIEDCFPAKNSSCPERLPNTACDDRINYCAIDCHCPGYQKCCPNSCGRMECFVPESRESEQLPDDSRRSLLLNAIGKSIKETQLDKLREEKSTDGLTQSKQPASIDEQLQKPAGPASSRDELREVRSMREPSQDKGSELESDMIKEVDSERMPMSPKEEYLEGMGMKSDEGERLNVTETSEAEERESGPIRANLTEEETLLDKQLSIYTSGGGGQEPFPGNAGRQRVRQMLTEEEFNMSEENDKGLLRKRKIVLEDGPNNDEDVTVGSDDEEETFSGDITTSNNSTSSMGVSGKGDDGGKGEAETETESEVSILGGIGNVTKGKLKDGSNGEGEGEESGDDGRDSNITNILEVGGGDGKMKEYESTEGEDNNEEEEASEGDVDEENKEDSRSPLSTVNLSEYLMKNMEEAEERRQMASPPLSTTPTIIGQSGASRVSSLKTLNPGSNYALNGIKAGSPKSLIGFNAKPTLGQNWMRMSKISGSDRLNGLNLNPGADTLRSESSGRDNLGAPLNGQSLMGGRSGVGHGARNGPGSPGPSTPLQWKSNNDMRKPQLAQYTFN